jgi:hypothetical protein
MTDPTRPAWLDRFIDAHGERFIFLGGATLFAIVFVIIGIKIEALNGPGRCRHNNLDRQWHVTI